ncbi:ribonuclease J [Haploplasma axanthum]|uniref:Hydrolase n=1 Tax=Haploplasma axanthum TaxID=29552 RepID=A0A449BED2_HAPAX|nr:ribonuclease J [Haploplasma axanthum]VEU80809.1 hydrolase [Haploplasma axanthum]
MSQIRFFALGGLAENGKNMFIVEVDKDLFILDAGIKYPSSELYGVDEIIPDYRGLLRIKDRVKGIFMSHAHEDHIAALSHVLKDLNIPVYATNFTMEIIKDNLKEAGYDLSKLTLNIINQNSIIKFGNVRVTFFNTTHSIPESVGIAIQTTRGSIVYTSDFTFDQSGDIKYQTDFGKINELTEKKVLALLTESVGSTEAKTSHTNFELDHKLNSIFSNAEGRILVSLFSSDLLKIQRVIDIAIAHKKKIAIIGRKAQRIVDIAIKEGYLEIPEESLTNLRFIDEKNNNEGKDIVALITGSRHEPFYMIQRMCKKSDRLIHINERDTVIIMTAPVPGTEKMAARTLDVLFRSDAHVEVIDKKLLSFSHANADEIKMMINMLKPKYIIPVIGEYRHQYSVRKLAMQLGYKEDEVFLMDNGDVLTFEEKPFVSKNDIAVGEILIDGTAVGDVNDYVLRDRELLAEDGALIIVAHVDPRKKQIVGDVEIVTKGFVYVKESEELLNSIKDEFMKISEKYLNSKYINWSEYKKDARNALAKFVFQETKRNPITIPVIISTESSN